MYSSPCWSFGFLENFVGSMAPPPGQPLIMTICLVCLSYAYICNREEIIQCTVSQIMPSILPSNHTGNVLHYIGYVHSMDLSSATVLTSTAMGLLYLLLPSFSSSRLLHVAIALQKQSSMFPLFKADGWICWFFHRISSNSSCVQVLRRPWHRYRCPPVKH